MLRKGLNKMKKSIFILVMLFVFAGCSGCIMSDLKTNLPNNEFSKFEYHRATSGWTKDIVASNGKIEDNTLIVEKVDFKSAYPFVSFSIVLEDYKVEVPKNEEE